MSDAPERIWLSAPDEVWFEDGEGRTEYTRADIAERQIAELRAELNANPRWKPKAEELAVKLVAAEAENARLRALPLKDEVERGGISRIAAERRRQVEEEGWTQAHDATHTNGELAIAAACYALNAADNGDFHAGIDFWPWADEWWKPSGDPIRDLEKAGALITAEIDRLMRPVDRAGIDGLKSSPAHTLQSLTIKEVERILEPFARHGDTTADYVEIKSDDLRAARALLSHLRAGVQEGWRLIERGETIEADDEVIADDAVSWVKVDRWAVGSPYHSAFKSIRRALPAAPSEQGGDRP